MTALAARLSLRNFAAASDSLTPGQLVTCPLLDLAPGSRARICGYSSDLTPSTCRRLFDLGFAPGATVDVIRKAPLQDPIVFRVAECEMAIRRALARGVLVEAA